MNQIQNIKKSSIINVDRKILIFASIGLLAILSGVFVALEQYIFLGLIFLILFTLFSAINIKIAIYAFYVSVFIPFGYINRYIISVPNVLRWLPYLFLGLSIVLTLLKDKKGSKNKFGLPPSLIWIGLSWILISIFSIIINNSGILPAIWSFRSFALIFGSIYIHRSNFSNADQFFLLRSLIILGFLTIPITILQRFLVAPTISNVQFNYDMVTGLFASYIELVFFQIFCIIVVISSWLHKKQLIPGSPIIHAFLLFIPLAISYSKAAPLFFFASLLYLLWLCRKRISLRFFGAIFVIIIIGIFGIIIFNELFQSNNSVSLYSYYNLDRIINYFFYQYSDGQLQRGAAVAFNFELILKVPHGLFIGLGPGSFSDSQLPGATGHIYSKFPNININHTSISTIFGELGISGILLIFSLLLSIYFINSKDEKGEMDVIRKGAIFLLLLLLPYGQYLLFPITALILGLISIQKLNNN